MKKKIKTSFIKNIKDLDKTLLILTIIMFVFGLLNIANASSSEAVTRYGQDLLHYFNRQLLILVAGIVPFLYIINTPTKKFKGYAILGYVIVLGLLIYMLLYGVAHKGAIAWINLPLFGSLQPSEFAKPVVIVMLAILFENGKKVLLSDRKEKINLIGIILIIGFLIPFILFLQKDLGTGIIIGFISFIMLLVSPIKRKDKFNSGVFITVTGLSLLFLLVIINGSVLTKAQKDRFTFFDPCSRYEKSGYQTCNAFIAINDGGLFGLGIGRSTQKYSYLAEPHTDSIFAIIAEEYGFIRTTLVFMFYALILKRIFEISANAVNLKGRYISLGVGVYIFIHIFLNLGGLFALIPLTGVPLPFLSYGGSYALSLVIALAIVQRVHIETKNQHLKI